MSLANTSKRFYRVVFRRDVLGPLGVSKKENAGQLVLPAAEEVFFAFCSACRLSGLKR